MIDELVVEIRTELAAFEKISKGIDGKNKYLHV
jgi:hypothetical protein